MKTEEELTSSESLIFFTAMLRRNAPRRRLLSSRRLLTSQVGRLSQVQPLFSSRRISIPSLKSVAPLKSVASLKPNNFSQVAGCLQALLSSRKPFSLVGHFSQVAGSQALFSSRRISCPSLKSSELSQVAVSSRRSSLKSSISSGLRSLKSAPFLSSHTISAIPFVGPPSLYLSSCGFLVVGIHFEISQVGTLSLKSHHFCNPFRRPPLYISQVVASWLLGYS